MKIRSQQNYVKKSQLPQDIKVATDQTTLTYGQLQQAIRDNQAERLILGISARQGFDSCMFTHRAVVVNDELYLLGRSHIPSSSLQRNAIVLNLKTHTKQIELYEPSAKSIVDLTLPSSAPVWIGVKKNFSWKGEMILFAIEVVGPQCFVSLSGSEEREEDYEVYHEVGELSIWGRQLFKQDPPQQV